MFEHEVTVYRFMHHYGRKLLADVSEAQFKTPAFAGGNPPSWIVGHLTVSADFILGVLGKPRLLPKSWMVLFGPGSDPFKHLDRHPDHATLIAAYEAGHQAVFEAMKDADASKLSGPSPFEPLKEMLPTAGDLLAHLLTSHEAFHISQLSACRRSTGNSPLF